MPRYLGLNYLAEALQRRRRMLSQMLLTIPSHLEYVEIYAHNGTIDNTIRHIPLEKESAFKLSSKQPIDYLTQLTSSIHHPEPYNPENTEEDIVPSSNPDSPLVSFDVWSDLEEEVANYVINSLAPDKEQFTSTRSGNMHEDSAKDKLEEMECLDYLHDAVQHIPKARNLCARLKTKLVQDPLSLNNKGNPLEEKNVLRTELQAPFDKRSEERPRGKDKETFLKILANDETTGNESTVEDKEIESLICPVIPAAAEQLLYTGETQRLLDLHKHSEFEAEKSELVLCKTVFDDEVEAFFDSTAVRESKEKEVNKINFVTLNDGEVRCDDPLEDEQLLESPSHLPSVPVTDDNSKKFMRSLKAFELSPGMNSPPLTPDKVAQCVQNIWENEKLLFSGHLAMVFPVPSTSTGKRKHRSMTPIQVAIKKLTLSQECLDGKLELGLPWDPLAISATAMETCQRNIQRLSVLSVQEEQGETLCLHRALFHSGETFHRASLQEDESHGGLPREVSSSEIQVEKQSQDNKESIPMTFEKQDASTPNTFEAPKRSANLVPLTSTTTSVVTVRSLQEESKSKLFVGSRPGNSSCIKQASGGLEDFLLMRKGKLGTRTSSTHPPCTPPKTIMKAAKIRPSVFTKDTSESDQHAPTDPIKPRKACQEQQKDITVELIDEFQEVLDELIGHVKPLLIRLQDNGVIPPTKTVSSLNPDYTRFVLKQAQMSTRERDENSKEMQIYCITVCLHALVSSVDILMQSGLEASIAYLSLTQERYGSLLGGALESTRRYLFETHFNFQEGKILHPKLLKLLNIVAQWSKEKDVSDERAAIIAYTFPEKVKNEIRETLSGLHGIQVKLYKSTTDLNELQAKGMLAVYLIGALDIREDFAWDSFDFVLDYDPTTSIERETLSRSSRLKDYVRLRTVAKALLDEQSALESKGSGIQILEKQDQFIFIGSENITENVDLLHLLETSHNVLIYERRYNDPRLRNFESKMCLQPDLMVDERTCIHLQHLPTLTDETELEQLRDTVLSLSLKCDKCYIILYSSNQPDYAFTGDVLRRLSILFASFASSSEFELEILYSFTVVDTAKLIRQVGETTRTHSSVWNKLEWTKRKWLTNEASANEMLTDGDRLLLIDSEVTHEKLLLSIPCLNSFSAQVMLTAAPLAELLKMSREELKETCPWIPQRTLTEFYKTVNWCSELDDDPTAHSFAQPMQRMFQPCNQISQYIPFMEEPPPCRMTSDLKSTPGNVEANITRPVYTSMVSDYRRDWLQPLNNTQNKQEIIRDVASDWGYYTYSCERSNPTTVGLPDNWRDDRYDPVLPVLQRDRIGTHCRQSREGLSGERCENDVKSFALNNSSSKLWENRDDVDLIQCITSEMLPNSRYQVNQQPQLKADQLLAFKGDTYSSQEIYGNLLHSIPCDFSDRPGTAEYLGREAGLKRPVSSSTGANPSARVGGYTMLPPRRGVEGQRFLEACWNINRLNQRLDEPDSQPRACIDPPQEELKRLVERDPLGNRKRQAVRVLDLGNEASHAPPTKVGIAQPQRRSYSSSGQVLGENSVASQHKRFSLGIDRSIHPTKRPHPQQLSKGELQLPAIRPSPEKSDEWPAFPSYLSSKRKKLTYEKIPGLENGQTKLVFKNDF